MAIDISQMTLKEMVWSSSLLESNLVNFFKGFIGFWEFSGWLWCIWMCSRN